jgi:hypothetical protein
MPSAIRRVFEMLKAFFRTEPVYASVPRRHR